jgi:hypothetical protein
MKLLILVFGVVVAQVRILYILRVCLHITIFSQIILIWIIMIFIMKI